MTSEQHNRYIAYSFFAYAGIQVLSLLFIVVVWLMVFLKPSPQPGEPEMPSEFIAIMLVFMSVFFLLFTVPALIAGWAMIKQKSWARTAGMVGAIFSAMSAPVGTAACVYSLWFWTSDRWKEVYDDASERDRSMLGLNRAEDFQPADDLHDVVQRDWIKEPPDWR
jgi:cytochrome b561